MKQVIILTVFHSLLLFFINNEEALATRVKRSPFDSKIKQLPFSPDDARTDPERFCNKFSGYYSPTVKAPANADLTADAEAVRKAIKGIGMRDGQIIGILTKRGIIQRLKIAEIYSEKKHGNLLNDLRFDAKGKYQDTITAFMTPLAIYYAKEAEKALGSKPADEKTLVEIFGFILAPAVKGIMEFYERLFDYKKLMPTLKANTKGNFQTIMVKILEAPIGNREREVDKASATTDAKNLHSSVKTWAKDPAMLNTILATHAIPQLELMYTEYKKVSGHELEDDIKAAFPGEPGMFILAKALKNKPKFFAERLNESLNPKVKDPELIRVIVSRSEMDLGAIKDAYKTLYGKTLDSEVGSKLGGNYKDILLGLINGGSAGAPAPPPPKPGK